jgi:hypothetical protein
VLSVPKPKLHINEDCDEYQREEDKVDDSNGNRIRRVRDGHEDLVLVKVSGDQ